MKVQAELIRHYLKPLATGRGASSPDPMADPGAFDGDIDEMARRARADGNTEWLRLSLNALVNGPPSRLAQFSGTLYPFSEDEFAGILRRAQARIWPGEVPPEPGDETPVEFAEMTDEEWAAQREPGLGF